MSTKKEINHIYLDMDGVISDLDMKMVNKWKSDGKFIERFTNFIKRNGFSKLSMIDDGKLLLDYLMMSRVRVTILSSAGSPQEGYFEKVEKQKKNWLKEHGINYHAIIVFKKEDKKKYAGPNSLLIDDTESNCLDFEEHGGSAIYHSSAVHTISMLNKYFLKAS